MPITTTLIGKLGGWQRWDKVETPGDGYIYVAKYRANGNIVADKVNPRSKMYPESYEIYVIPIPEFTF